MECPNCGKTETQVIDSRLIKDDMGIRRRRKCMSCAARFTTYETTEDRFFPFLLQKNMVQGTSINSLNMTLNFIIKTLNMLSQETEKLVLKLNKLEKTQEEKKQEEKDGKADKEPSEKKISPARERDVTATDIVLKIILQNKDGIDIPSLKDKTGFNDKKIRNIIHRAVTQGKIKRVERGVYVFIQ